MKVYCIRTNFVNGELYWIKDNYYHFKKANNYEDELGLYGSIKDYEPNKDKNAKYKLDIPLTKKQFDKWFKDIRDMRKSKLDEILKNKNKK